MIFHNAGKFDGREDSLPKREHPEGSVRFKEPEDMQKLALIASLGSVITMVVLAVPYILLGRRYIGEHSIQFLIACICSLIILVPHEFLHAICFKKDVWMYSNLKQGMLFVIGTEDMSRSHFVFMSLLPNLVFGFVPYIIFLFMPQLTGLGAFGILCVGMGFGDYINVYNALTQVPADATVYLSGMHSYWYIPKQPFDK